ncbi:hypothetical protein KJ815_06955, partial [bacterium]|nr:hypothetical protein [bacterium]
KRWSRLCESLGGRGVPSLDREFKRVHYGPVIEAFHRFASPAHLRELIEESAPPPASSRKRAGEAEAAAVAQFAARAKPFLEQAKRFGHGNRAVGGALGDFQAAANAVLALPAAGKWITWGRSKDAVAARQRLLRALPARRSLSEPLWRVLAGWLTIWAAGQLHTENGDSIAADRLDDWLLLDVLHETFRALGADNGEAWLEVEWVRGLTAHRRIAMTFDQRRRYLGMAKLLEEGIVQRVIGCNEYGGIVWFHRESFERLTEWLYVMRVVGLLMNPKLTRPERGRMATAAHNGFHQIEDIAAISEYQLERLRTLLGYFA